MNKFIMRSERQGAIRLPKEKGDLLKMRKIKLLPILLALVLAMSVMLTGCSGYNLPDEDHDHDHDHNHDHEEDFSQLFLPIASIITPGYLAKLHGVTEDEVKGQPSTDGTRVLRVISVDGNIVYCTHNNSSIADHVIIDPDFEVSVDKFILCKATYYYLDEDQFSFGLNEVYDGLYVMYGSDLKDVRILTQSQAAPIFNAPNFD